MSVAARQANDRIAAKALRLRFTARVPFICECSDPDCREFILLRADEYVQAQCGGRTYIALPGHALTDAGPSGRARHGLRTTNR